MESGGEFSVEQLREFGMGEKGPEGGRPALYTTEILAVRLVPKNLIASLGALYEKTRDERQFLQTLYSAFYIYRECVNTGFEAVLSVKDNACEWPQPRLFPWSDVDAINFMGMAMGAMKRNDTVAVSIDNKGQRETTDLFTGEKKIEKISGITGDPPHNFVFKVGKLKDIRVVASQPWQNTTLRAYGRGAERALDDLRSGRDVEAKVKDFVKYLLAEFPKMEVKFPVGRYTKSGEVPNPSFLFS